MVILATRKIDWARFCDDNKWLLMLFLYMGVSILWSDYAVVSLKRWIKTTGDLVMVLIILTDRDYLAALSCVLRRCFYIHIPLSIILIKYYRTIGVAWDDLGVEMWVGVTPHKNTLGELTMTAGVYFIWDIMRSLRKKQYLRIGIDSFFLLMVFWILRGSETSRSNAAIAVFFIGVLVLFAVHRLRSKPGEIIRFAKVGILVLAFVYLAMGVIAQKSLFATAVEASGRDMTLTGRTILWEDLIEIGSRNPIMGTGYGGFWIGNLTHNLWQKHFWRPRQGHNGYIDIFVDLGLLGVFGLAAVLYASLKTIFRTFAHDFDYAQLRLAFFSMIVIHNIVESNLTIGTHQLWFIFLLAAISAPALSLRTSE